MGETTPAAGASGTAPDTCCSGVSADAALEAASPATATAVDPCVIDASLRVSMKDGLAWAVMVGAGERYVNPFIILGPSGVLRLGAISALPTLVGSIVQCFAANVVDRAGQRKPFFVLASALQALSWVPFCVGMFLPLHIGYWLMLASFALYIGFGNAAGPPWTSVMGDLVPADRRGRYFGLRSGLIGAGLIVSTLGAGGWVTYASDRPELALLGLSGRNFAFLSLFLLAMVARLMSAHYLHQMYEPPYHRQTSDRFSLLDFIRRAPQAHFGRFVIYCMLLNVGVGFLGPYFFWYILGELKFSPFAFAVIGAVQWLAYYGFIVLWGHLADRIGSKRVLALGGIGMAGVPLLLLLADNFWWFVIVQVYDGLVSSAYGLAAVNYLLDVVTPPKRARCAAYQALFVAVGTAIGTFAAALVLAYAPLPLHVGSVAITHPFKLLLIGSTLLRLLPSLLLLGSFQEFRLQRPVFIEERVPGL